MSSVYPAQIDTSITVPVLTDTNFSNIIDTFNTLRQAVLQVEGALGVNPAVTYGTVRARLDVLESLINAGGIILTGDLGGSPSDPLVVGIQGRPVSSAAPTIGQALGWDGFSWSPISSIAGAVNLSGDVSGASNTNTVIKINGASVPAAGSLTTGNVLQVSGSSSLSYGAVNLAGGANFVSGVLPVINQAAQTMGGDVSGTTASSTVIKINGVSVNATPSVNQVLIATSGTTSTWAQISNAQVSNAAAITYGKLNLNNSIVDADVNSGAAISGTKINPAFGAQNISTTGTLAAHATTVSSLRVSGVSTGIGHYDGSGNLTSSAVNLASADVSGVLPTANQAAQILSGDLTGSTAAANVIKIQGNAVLAQVLGASQDGYVLTWVNANSDFEAKPASGSGGSAGGDLLGTYPNPTVAALRGKTLASSLSSIGADQDGYVLTWNNTNNDWESAPPTAILAVGKVYEFSNTSSDIPTYNELRTNANGAENDQTVTINSGSGSTLIEAFASQLGSPNVTYIPAGQWDIDYWGYVNSTSGGNSTLTFNVYTRTLGGTETLLFTRTTAALPTTIGESTVSFSYPTDTFINSTDRIVIKVYAQTTSNSSKIIHFVYDGYLHASHIHTPIVGAAVSLGGDLSGNTGNATVQALRGKTLASSLASIGATQDGYFLSWVNANNDWEAKPAPSGSFVASGDLSGSSSSQTVIGIDGYTISSKPKPGQTLVSDGTHMNPKGVRTYLNILAYGGDGTGTNFNDDALTAALADSDAVFGCPIYFPAGRYRFAYPIDHISNYSTWLIGDGSLDLNGKSSSLIIHNDSFVPKAPYSYAGSIIAPLIYQHSNSNNQPSYVQEGSFWMVKALGQYLNLATNITGSIAGWDQFCFEIFCSNLTLPGSIGNPSPIIDSSGSMTQNSPYTNAFRFSIIDNGSGSYKVAANMTTTGTALTTVNPSNVFDETSMHKFAVSYDGYKMRVWGDGYYLNGSAMTGPIAQGWFEEMLVFAQGQAGQFPFGGPISFATTGHYGSIRFSNNARFTNEATNYGVEGSPLSVDGYTVLLLNFAPSFVSDIKVIGGCGTSQIGGIIPGAAATTFTATHGSPTIVSSTYYPGYGVITGKFIRISGDPNTLYRVTTTGNFSFTITPSYGGASGNVSLMTRQVTFNPSNILPANVFYTWRGLSQQGGGLHLENLLLQNTTGEGVFVEATPNSIIKNCIAYGTNKSWTLVDNCYLSDWESVNVSAGLVYGMSCHTWGIGLGGACGIAKVFDTQGTTLGWNFVIAPASGGTFEKCYTRTDEHGAYYCNQGVLLLLDNYPSDEAGFEEIGPVVLNNVSSFEQIGGELQAFTTPGNPNCAVITVDSGYVNNNNALNVLAGPIKLGGILAASGSVVIDFDRSLFFAFSVTQGSTQVTMNGIGANGILNVGDSILFAGNANNTGAAYPLLGADTINTVYIIVAVNGNAFTLNKPFVGSARLYPTTTFSVTNGSGSVTASASGKVSNTQHLLFNDGYGTDYVVSGVSGANFTITPVYQGPTDGYQTANVTVAIKTVPQIIRNIAPPPIPIVIDMPNQSFGGISSIAQWTDGYCQLLMPSYEQGTSHIYNVSSDADIWLSVNDCVQGSLVITDTGSLLSTNRNLLIQPLTGFRKTIFNNTAHTLTIKTAAPSAAVPTIIGQTSVSLAPSNQVTITRNLIKLTGTVSISPAFQFVTGSGTQFTTQLYVNAMIQFDGTPDQWFIISSITNDTHCVIANPYQGVTLSGAAAYTFVWS